METARVGIREFRADMAQYISASVPVAITRHSQTVGYFIPTHGAMETDLVALREASRKLDTLITAHGVDVDAVVADFKTARRAA
jgi:hypothetical protein